MLNEQTFAKEDKDGDANEEERETRKEDEEEEDDEEEDTGWARWAVLSLTCGGFFGQF